MPSHPPTLARRRDAVVQVGRTMRVVRARTRLEAAGRAALDAHRRAAFDALVAHAWSSSPFLRAFWGDHGVRPGDDLDAFPILDKATVMANWDALVTDPGLTLTDARAAIVRGDETIRGHQVLATGGSSRVPGVFVFDRAGWDVATAGQARSMLRLKFTPSLPRRRMVGLYADDTRHMATRMGAHLDAGLHRAVRLGATRPLPELATALDRLQPELLSGYASVLGLLAARALDGGLSIAPRVVVSSSEPLTEAIRTRIQAAWSVTPHDVYALTETGPVAMDCSFHSGLHVHEDAVIVEPVGDRVLLTGLDNRLMPLVRYAVEDAVAWVPSSAPPCPCGSPLRRLTAVSGRVDDVLHLPTVGGSVPVHPTVWAGTAGLNEVAELEVVQQADTLIVRVVPRTAGAASVAHARVIRDLAAVGVDTGRLALRVEEVLTLPRGVAGKRRIIRREAAQP